MDVFSGVCLFVSVFVLSLFVHTKTSEELNVGRSNLAVRLVSWSWTSLFSTNAATTAISETKGHGWRVILTQWRKASDILASTLAAFLFSSYPKKERDREAHLNNNIITLAPTTGETTITSQDKNNQIQQKQTCIHKINLNKLNPGSVASYDLRPGNGAGLYSGRWEIGKGNKKKRDEKMEIGKVSK